MSLHSCLSSHCHFPGDLPHTGVLLSASLKFDARGVGCSECALDKAYPPPSMPAGNSCRRMGVFMEKMSALERLEGLGVTPMAEFENADSGAEEIERRIRTQMRPWLSVLDSVRPERHVVAVEGDDVTIKFDFGDGSCGGSRELRLDQKRCGSVFQQEE
ncbi:uncharacterized protein DS421_6g197200 [Arachis hypogaea]|nr:uncharacterized protein DS421_6g197200 [Arachis hypogaea]